MNGILRQVPLSESEAGALRAECAAILMRLCDMRTGGGSASMRVEDARGLADSIYYCINYHLHAAANPSAELRAIGADAAYEAGLAEIRRRVEAARLFYAGMLKRVPRISNVCFNATLRGGLAGFFKIYDPFFAAGDKKITADYPTLVPVTGLEGIEFICLYMERLDAENRFMGLFSASDIHHILCGVDMDYASLSANLCTPILMSALGAALLGQSRPTLSPVAAELLNVRFAKTTREEALGELTHAMEKFPLTDGARAYFTQAMPNIAGAARTGKAFRAAAYPESAGAGADLGEAMSTEDYRKLSEELASCESDAEREEAVIAYAKSLTDVIDLLENEEIGGAWKALLSRLEGEQLSAVIGAFTAGRGEEMLAAEDGIAQARLCEYLRDRDR